MTLTSAVLSFAAVAGLLTLVPGPDTALVVRTAASRGRRAGAACALGVVTGVVLWAVAAAAGLAALLAASGTAVVVVRVLGALYLLRLGFGMLRAALTAGRDDREAAGASGAGPSYRQGLVVNLTNPKMGLFYLALLPQFVPPGEPALLVGTLLGLVHAGEGLLWFGVLVVAVDRVGGLLRSRAARRWVDGVAGAALVALGVRLAVDPG